jgi:hypothetical protein
MSNRRLIPEENAKRTSVTLDVVSHEILLQFGEGNLSRGIRRVVSLTTAPTQGADARPVAEHEIRDVIARLAPTAKFAGNHGDRQAATDAIRMLATLGDAMAVLATRDSAPSDAQGVISADMHSLLIACREELRAWMKTYGPREGTANVVDSIQAVIVASAPREKT